jgi:hypothetical protein
LNPSVPNIVVVVTTVLCPSRLALTAATQVAEVVPAMVQVSLTEADMPAVTVWVTMLKFVGPSVRVI